MPTKPISSGTLAQQCAALPLLTDGTGSLTVGLITSRDTGRWVLPKGWLKDGEPAHKTAAEEAYEEAGLLGQILTEPVGSYTYRKRLDCLSSVVCEVVVYQLVVTTRLDDWPEKSQRHLAFFPPSVAAALVHEPGLASLLLSMEIDASA